MSSKYKPRAFVPTTVRAFSPPFTFVPLASGLIIAVTGQCNLSRGALIVQAAAELARYLDNSRGQSVQIALENKR
ncbi:hypothetical protein K7432_007409 [Basidiobolus ranarum]|uniref:Uncharacterized protein n=1 Tax=Basidiobolus ranarum TaxID=34480 RepID=A0ABR2W127_9FUNG